ncbi:NRPS-like enzyme [Aspergillus desertorum]
MIGLDPNLTLLPRLVDYYALEKPDAIYAEYPKSATSYEDGFYQVTDFANAVDGLAWWLTKSLGPGKGEILPYIGPNDLRYPALVLATVKAGYAAYDVPSVAELLGTTHSHFEFNKIQGEGAHTSGSTGIPKPIFWTHDRVNKHMAMGLLQTPEGYENMDDWTRGKRLFSVMPPFHAAGLAILLYCGLPLGLTIVGPTSVGLPTASALAEAMKQTTVNAAFVAPSLLRDLSQNPELLEYCSRHLDHIRYAGGDLPQAVGDCIASRIRLVNRYDWRYIQFHPALGMEFQQVTADEYELVIARKPETEAHAVPFTVFPKSQTYRTKDLWVRHPDSRNRDLWRYSARADDVIVFLNGEKTNPTSMEQHVIAANADVTGALVAGAQRFQVSLLVEAAGAPTLNACERAALIEKIWPSVQEANSMCPAHARVDKDHIMFTRPEKPMLRTGKGTIQRAATLAAYAEELDVLYADADKVSAQSGSQMSGPGRTMTRRQLLRWKEEQLGDQDNFFHLGLDSLQAIAATRTFTQGLDFPNFNVNMIYLHPTVSELTQAIICHQQEGSTAESQAAVQLQERGAMLQKLLDRVHIDKLIEKQAAVLTGSTGTLGTYLLHALLQNHSVSHVYCLNRSTDSISSQRQKSSLYHLDMPLDDPSRVTFWKDDLSRPNLGLAPDALSTLPSETTLIIHNAWAVNFNLSLSSLEPQLTGVINLLNLCSSSSHSPKLFFISSISSVMGHSSAEKTTPERIVTTTSPAPNGYATSKYLAERILDHAGRPETRNLRTAFARVGQIAGAANAPGLWNKTEWFPSLVLSSLHVGAVPDTVGPTLDRVDWVPVDLLAGSWLIQVFHPHNLSPISWSEITPVLAESLASHARKPAPLPTIPLTEWIRRLQAALERNPAAKLIAFFEGLAASTNAQPDNILETTETARRSEKLRGVHKVRAEWIKKWIEEWLA